MNFTDYLIEEYLTEWNAKQIQAFKDKFGDETYGNFEKAKDRLKNAGYSTDIQYYLSNKINKKELDTLLISLYSGKKDEQKKKNMEGKLRDVRGEYKYFGEFDGYLVFQPLDYLAAMDLGVNSGWCTTGRYGHYGEPDRKPDENQAKSEFDEYTDKGVKFYHFLNPRTFYGEYALAVYTDVKAIGNFVYDKQSDSLVWAVESNFELFNAKDNNIWYDCDVLEIARNNLHLNLQIEMDNSISIELQNGFKIENNTIIGYFGKDLKVVIPNGITKIGVCAFDGCTFKKVVIPDSVTEIRNCAFERCNSLTSIVIPDGVRQICKGTFLGCKKLTSIKIPNSVTKIGDSAFEDCELLPSITIPDSVAYIDESAFENCKSLTTIEIPNSVSEINCETFCDCELLTSITIPNSVTSIGGGAFCNCKSLTTITIPDSVTYLDIGVFNHCDALKIIYINSSNKNERVINELRQYADVYDKDTGELLYEKGRER